MRQEFDAALGRVHAREPRELVARTKGAYMKPVIGPRTGHITTRHGREDAAPQPTDEH